MRWYGPNDPVSLSDIRQSGCTGVVTALHHVAVGDIWTVSDIKKRVAEVEAAGMTWTVIESLPVHESIKKQSADSRSLNQALVSIRFLLLQFPMLKVQLISEQAQP